MTTKENFKGFIQCVNVNEMEIETIKVIKHVAPYHADDCYALGLILNFFNVNLYEVDSQKEISEEEYNDKKCFIIDVGMKYEVERSNFDHHQIKYDDQNKEFQTAFSLLSKKMLEEKYLKDRDIKSLISRISYQDNNGIPGLMKAFMKKELMEAKEDFKGVFESNFFMERQMIKLLSTERGELNEASKEIYRMFALVLKEKIDAVDRIERGKEFIESKKPYLVTKFHIEGEEENEEENISSLIWMDRPKDISLFDFNASQGEVLRKNRIDIIFGYNPRDGLRSLVLTPKAPRLNFNFLELPTKFIHANGFLAALELNPNLQKDFQDLICNLRTVIEKSINKKVLDEFEIFDPKIPCSQFGKFSNLKKEKCDKLIASFDPNSKS